MNGQKADGQVVATPEEFWSTDSFALAGQIYCPLSIREARYWLSYFTENKWSPPVGHHFSEKRAMIVFLNCQPTWVAIGGVSRVASLNPALRGNFTTLPLHRLKVLHDILLTKRTSWMPALDATMRCRIVRFNLPIKIRWSWRTRQRVVSTRAYIQAGLSGGLMMVARTCSVKSPVEGLPTLAR
jgi:hypothetical protein